MASRLKGRKTRAGVTRRTSISLPSSLHRELEKIAERKKVSLAWVIRDAAEAYVQAMYPLFAQKD